MKPIKWFFTSKYKKLLYQIECAKANGQRLHLSDGIVLDFTTYEGRCAGMSERQKHKKRYNLRLEYIAKFNKWLEAEPSMVFFWRWRRWKKNRPIWRDIEKGGEG